jgi:hypothetical protein
MLDAAVSKVIRLTIPTSSAQLKRVFASLSERARHGLRRELTQAGEAYRFEKSRRCAYYLRRDGARVIVWRWRHVASDSKAARMQSLIAMFAGRLDAYRAAQVFELAAAPPTAH